MTAQEEPVIPGCEDFAMQWLTAEERALGEPVNRTLADTAARQGEARDEPIRAEDRAARTQHQADGGAP